MGTVQRLVELFRGARRQFDYTERGLNGFLEPNDSEACMIVVVVEDLIFLSKIQQTAGQVGVPIESLGPDKLGERLARGGVRAVIIDLNHRSGAAVDVVRALKSNPSTRHIQITGFLSHVQADLAIAAREAGCDHIMARSKFTQQLPELLLELAGEGAPPSPQN
jgi:CheY-like chemotaxis protein